MATISKFREFPKTKTVWQAFWLGLVSILIWPIAAFIVSMRPVMTKAIGVRAGPGRSDWLGGYFCDFDHFGVDRQCRRFRERGTILDPVGGVHRGGFKRVVHADHDRRRIGFLARRKSRACGIFCLLAQRRR